MLCLEILVRIKTSPNFKPTFRSICLELPNLGDHSLPQVHFTCVFDDSCIRSWDSSRFSVSDGGKLKINRSSHGALQRLCFPAAARDQPLPIRNARRLSPPGIPNTKGVYTFSIRRHDRRCPPPALDGRRIRLPLGLGFDGVGPSRTCHWIAQFARILQLGLLSLWTREGLREGVACPFILGRSHTRGGRDACPTALVG